MADEQKKLTIDDLIRSQKENEKHLSEISRCVSMLINATYRKKNYGIGACWFLLGGPVWFLCQGNPVAQQIFSSLCLFVITGVLLFRGYGISPAVEFEEDENAAKSREQIDKRLVGFGSLFTHSETTTHEQDQRPRTT
jgi:hypothetical protein